MNNSEPSSPVPGWLLHAYIWRFQP